MPLFLARNQLYELWCQWHGGCAADDDVKNVWKSDKSWEPEKIWKFENLNLKIWKFKFKNQKLNGWSWSSGHAEQLLFSSLCSKIAVNRRKLQWVLFYLTTRSIDIFNFKQRLLSLYMKTKVVQHVPRISLSHFDFWISNLNFKIFNFSLVPSFCLTFRHF